MGNGNNRLPPLMPGHPSPVAAMSLSGAMQELSAARIRPLRGWWWRMTERWEMRHRTVPNGMLYIPIDLALEVRVADERRLLRPGMLAVMPANVPQAARFPGLPVRRFDLLCLHVDAVDRHGRDLLARVQPRFLPVPGWPASLPRLRALAEAIHAGGADGLAFATIALRALLADLIVAAGGLAPAADPDPRIARCLELIAADRGGRLDVATLARTAGLGERRLRDLFRAATGVGPKEFLIRRRIAEATRMLTDPAVRVKAVAQELGFGSDHEFHACFRRVTGSTPTVWRQGGGGVAAGEHG
ncbi:MAG: helix-turn-helix transcriptional regulator [Planctomycetes bacterium]|nr:helix-turn-helix transcriptional regulator [Planctomycetota bacterium]